MKQFIEIEFEEHIPVPGFTMKTDMVTNWAIIDRESVVFVIHDCRELTVRTDDGGYACYTLTERGYDQLGADLGIWRRAEVTNTEEPENKEEITYSQDEVLAVMSDEMRSEFFAWRSNQNGSLKEFIGELQGDTSIAKALFDYTIARGVEDEDGMLRYPRGSNFSISDALFRDFKTKDEELKDTPFFEPAWVLSERAKQKYETSLKEKLQGKEECDE